MQNEHAQIVQKFIDVAPYIPMFYDEPVSVAITNKERFVYNQPCAEIPVKADLEKPFPDGSTCKIVVQTGERIVREVSEKVYGVPFISYAIPLKNSDGEIEGCMLIAKSIARIKRAQNSIEMLSNEAQEVSDTATRITSEVSEYSSENYKICEMIDALYSEAEKMNEILAFINKISNSTKILGLNAAIEAARVGEAGKGFSVVAKEIERMSANTTDSAQKISKMLESIQEKMSNISSTAKDTAEGFDGQVTSLESIVSTIQNLNANMTVLEDYINKL